MELQAAQLPPLTKNPLEQVKHVYPSEEQVKQFNLELAQVAQAPEGLTKYPELHAVHLPSVVEQVSQLAFVVLQASQVPEFGQNFASHLVHEDPSLLHSKQFALTLLHKAQVFPFTKYAEVHD